jgi:hypothetical protein
MGDPGIVRNGAEHDHRRVSGALRGNADAAVASAEHALRLNSEDLLFGYFAISALTVAHFAAGGYGEAVAWTRKTIQERSDILAAMRCSWRRRG